MNRSGESGVSGGSTGPRAGRGSRERPCRRSTLRPIEAGSPSSEATTWGPALAHSRAASMRRSSRGAPGGVVDAVARVSNRRAPPSRLLGAPLQPVSGRAAGSAGSGRRLRTHPLNDQQYDRAARVERETHPPGRAHLIMHLGLLCELGLGRPQGSPAARTRSGASQVCSGRSSPRDGWRTQSPSLPNSCVSTLLRDRCRAHIRQTSGLCVLRGSPSSPRRPRSACRR